MGHGDGAHATRHDQVSSCLQQIYCATVLLIGRTPGALDGSYELHLTPTQRMWSPAALQLLHREALSGR